MCRDSDTKIDNETLTKTVVFSNALHYLETVKTYLIQQVVNNSIFSSQHKIEKELFRVRNQRLSNTAHQAGLSRRSLAGVGLSESVRCRGPGLVLLTNGGVQQQQRIYKLLALQSFEQHRVYPNSLERLSSVS
ncbi:hypothetical protein TNCV_1192811 [Trichonephila clavipes]|nr:hypothetical protein TNCV_1192811 [Trichonephila clavipes]